MEVNHIARQIFWYHNVAYQVKSFLPLDIVGISEMQKWGLKYGIHSPGNQPGLQIITPTQTLGSSKYVEHMLTI